MISVVLGILGSLVILVPAWVIMVAMLAANPGQTFTNSSRML
jgi:hypothetical protein